MAKELEKVESTADKKANKTNDKAAKKAAVSKKSKKSIVKYFKDLKSEFKKVVWPSKKTVFNNTVVVLISLVVSGILVWGLDLLFASLIKLMLGMA